MNEQMNEWAMKDDYIIHKDKRMTVQFKRTNKIKREREREIEELNILKDRVRNY